MANYAVEMRRTASSSASVGSITADSTRPRRGKLYDLTFGSEATPAANAFLWRVRRCTAAGTSTAVVPVPLDPADALTETDAGTNHTVEPTYVANSQLISVPVHQTATFRWQVIPGREIIWPATAAAGLGLETPVASTVVVTAVAYFEEE